MRDLEQVAFVALKGRRVLLVDDNEIERIVTAELLGDVAGMRVDSVADGEAALQRFAADRFDLVLMDLRMPVLDGYETTRRLRRLPGGGTLPVIALSAHVEDGERDRCREAGFDDVLAKPCEAPRLFAMVRRWLTDAPDAPAAPPTADGTVPAFSAELGLRRCVGRRDLYERIARRYLDAPVDACTELARAWDAGDVAQASHLAHTLISTAGTLGASALSDLARTLQAAARAGDEAWWRAVLADAHAEQARVAEDLRAWLSGGG